MRSASPPETVSDPSQGLGAASFTPKRSRKEMTESSEASVWETAERCVYRRAAAGRVAPITAAPDRKGREPFARIGGMQLYIARRIGRDIVNGLAPRPTFRKSGLQSYQGA